MQTTICSKRRYLTRKIARQQKRNIGRIAGKTYTIYKCQACQCFHLTSITVQASRRYKQKMAVSG